MQSVAAADGTDLWFATHGDPASPALLLGPHFYASFDVLEAGTTQRWVDGLKGDFFVIVADYPRGMGRTGHPLGRAYSPDIAVDDYRRIVRAAGAERVGWLGYSFGAAMGVQLACRTDWISALAVGGFPPLDAPFREMVEITTRFAEMDTPGADPDLAWSSAAFYSALLDWPERTEVGKLGMPRMAFMGTADDGMPGHGIDTPLAAMLRGAEPDLTALGWQVEWLDGANHVTAIATEVSLRRVRDFFRAALPG